MRQLRRSPAAGRRRWLQYSLRTALLVSTVLAIWLGAVTQRARQQRRIVAAIQAVGGSVTYDYPQRPGAEAGPPGPSWLRSIVGDDYFQSVKRIDLSQSPADDALLERIAGLSDLESLDASGSKMTDAGLPHLGRLRKLRSLNLSFTAVTDRGFAAIGPLLNLERIRLDATSVGDESLRALARSNLSLISFHGTRITDRGLQYLAAFPSLGELDLGSTRITDVGLEYLTGLSELSYLRLNEGAYDPDLPPRITDAGIEHLAKLTKLRELGLMNCGITDAGLARLAELKRLEVLNVFHLKPAFTPDGVAKLRAALPTLTIYDR